MEQKHVLAWPRAAGSTMGPQAVPPGLGPVRAVGSKLLAEIWGTAYTRATGNLRLYLTNRAASSNPTRPGRAVLVTEPGTANDSSRTRQTAGKTRITDPAP